jgi:hypothetical protein
MATINTTWTSPASATLDKATGATIDEAMTDALASNFYHLGGAAGHIAVQSLANGTATALSFNSERYDLDPNGAIHDNATNNTRLTCRTAGYYLIVGACGFVANTTGDRRLDILYNGTTQLVFNIQHAVQGGVNHVMQASVIYQLAASDYVELRATQNSGGALNTIQDTYAPNFMIAKL